VAARARNDNFPAIVHGLRVYRNDRSVLRSVSSTFAESLIVTNDLSAVARIVIVHDAKGHTREFIKSRVVIERFLLLSH